MAETGIMIVEDERIVALDLQQRLKALGYRVAALAARGEEAVAQAEETRPDLVLMDIRLNSELDGIEAAEQIRSRLQIPVIYLTAYADEQTLARAKITEPYGYILKPFEERELQTTIEMALYRHRADRALRESEERYRHLVQNSLGLIAVHDLNGVLLAVNPAGAHALGYEPDELVGQNLFDFIAPAARSHVGTYVKQITANPTAEGLMVVVTRSGEERVWQYRNARIEEPGKAPYVLGHAQDITERRRAEEALRQQNVYLTALHETSLGLMRRLNLEELLEAIITHAGKLVGTEHGYVFLRDPGDPAAGAPDEIEMRVGVGVYSGLVGARARRGVGLAGTVWQTGEPLVVDDYRTWGQRLTDPRRDVLRAVAGVPLKSDGDDVGVIGLAYLEEGRTFGPSALEALTRFSELAVLALDNARLYAAAQRELAERKLAEEALQKFRLGIERADEAIFITDTDGTIRYVNPAFERIYGYTRAETVGQTPRLLKSGQQSQAVYEHLWKALLTKQAVTGELINKTKDGRWVAVEGSANPILNDAGAIVGFLAIQHDITARKREAEEKLAFERHLQETQKLESLGVLAGGIAHDFNNLLVSILGNVGLVLLDLEPASPVREPVEQVKIAAQRAADLTKQMLAYSGKGRFVMQAVNLNAVLQEMSQLLKVSISKNAALRLNLSDNLPAVEADATQIRQIVMNLLTNASDAIGNRPGVITLSTGVVNADRVYLAQTFMAPDLPAGRYVYLEVADDGCGMDAETRARIFDPFFTTKFAGRGLGLAAVLGILRGHGGSIRVYSEPGHGSVFRILLPCKEAPKTADAAPSATFKNGNGTVLLIDDEEVVRTVTKRMLERFGYTPLVAEDGASGLQLLRAHCDEVACILLDMTMPRMSGEETYLEIQKVKPNAKVLLMSGYTETEATRRFKNNGPADFMQKPYTPEELQEKLHAVMNGKKEEAIVQ
jgi:PAS domain S-box-containing protein